MEEHRKCFLERESTPSVYAVNTIETIRMDFVAGGCESIDSTFERRSMYKIPTNSITCYREKLHESQCD
jgi:hypothetical protein